MNCKLWTTNLNVKQNIALQKSALEIVKLQKECKGTELAVQKFKARS
jgi:hypothetical protein